MPVLLQQQRQRNATSSPRSRAAQHRRSRLTKGRRTPSTPRHGDVVPSPGAQRPRVARPRLRAKGVSRAEPGEPDTPRGARRHVGPGGRITFFLTPPEPRSAPAPSPGTRPRVRVRAASETREGTCFLVLAAACMVVVAEHTVRVRPLCPKCACLQGPALSCLFGPVLNSIRLPCLIDVMSGGVRAPNPVPVSLPIHATGVPFRAKRCGSAGQQGYGTRHPLLRTQYNAQVRTT